MVRLQGATKGSARDLPSMNVVGTGGAASLLVPTQPQAQATRQARSTMASTLKGGRGQNVLQALADEQCASSFDCLSWMVHGRA